MAAGHAERGNPRRTVRSANIDYRREGGALARLLGGSREKQGVVTNLSRNGVQFRTTEALKAGTPLALVLHLPGDPTPVRMKAQAKWSVAERKVARDITFTHVVGAQFTQYSPQAWEAVRKALRE